MSAYYGIPLPHYAELVEPIEYIKCLSNNPYRVCGTSKMRCILLIICYVTYGAVCHQPTHFSPSDCEGIFIHLVIIIKLDDRLTVSEHHHEH